MTALVTGVSGLLGSEFAKVLGEEVVGAGRAELDPRLPDRLRRLLDQSAPELVINCAADVDAEAAETNPDASISANVLLPQLLAWECRRRGVPLVHFSSTGCYGEWKSGPYTEDDAVRPTTVHHRSKVAGEEAVREAGGEHLILRTGWLFGGGPGHARNFVWRRLLEATSRPSLKCDTGQRGNPTYARDVAVQALVLARRGVRGTFNCVARGEATRYDYVARIVSAAGLRTRLEPTGPFQRAAPVSSNESALNYRAGLLGLDRMPDWGASLDGYIGEVMRWPEWRRALAEVQPPC